MMKENKFTGRTKSSSILKNLVKKFPKHFNSKSVKNIKKMNKNIKKRDNLKRPILLSKKNCSF